MRYDVSIKIIMTHSVAVEADSLLAAQDAALAVAGSKEADKMDTIVEVEVGNG